MVSPTTVKALLRELTSLQRNPPADIRVALSEADILSFSGWILGPPSTPYAGGFFRVTFNFDGVDFPNAPPICRFATPIFHPNVSRSGEICVSSLKKDWKREYGIERILVTIRCLLVEPNPDSALDAEASRLMQEDWATYEETARLWTSVHAEKRPACFEEDKAEQGRVAASEPARPSVVPTLPVSCSASASAATPHTIKAAKSVSAAPKRGLRRL